LGIRDLESGIRNQESTPLIPDSKFLVPSPSLFIACGALAKDAQAIIAKYHWPITLKALPAHYHLTPQKIAPAIDALLSEIRDDYDQVIVLYGECGAVGLEAVLTKHRAVRVGGAHCYEIYAGSVQFAQLMDAEPGTFFLTDWLLRAYDKAVWRGLGLDRYPELVPLYFGNYRRLVYLSQLPTPKLLAKAQTIANALGLTFEHRPVGYGELENRLERVS